MCESGGGGGGGAEEGGRLVPLWFMRYLVVDPNHESNYLPQNRPTKALIRTIRANTKSLNVYFTYVLSGLCFDKHFYGQNERAHVLLSFSHHTVYLPSVL